jgi:hypothetical protein
VSGCSAGRLHLWDGANPEASKPLATVENAHDLGVTCLAFAPALVTGKETCTIMKTRTLVKEQANFVHLKFKDKHTKAKKQYYKSSQSILLYLTCTYSKFKKFRVFRFHFTMYKHFNYSAH